MENMENQNVENQEVNNEVEQQPIQPVENAQETNEGGNGTQNVNQ